ncbi:MAG: putative oxidoreductase iron-sulfur subunit, associated with bss3 [Firmicutes bacterium]|nr:putative oxidoreductase iron-sulfur subunit, associated with bss3 [Bacillota bacterium]
MSKKNNGYGLLIDYEYCTGCHTCEIACAQEYKWPAGMGGIRVIESIQELPNNKAYLTYIPFPTELCILCAGRTQKGEKPACVQNCMAACMEYGPVEELAGKITKPRMVLWVPR